MSDRYFGDELLTLLRHQVLYLSLYVFPFHQVCFLCSVDRYPDAFSFSSYFAYVSFLSFLYLYI